MNRQTILRGVLTFFIILMMMPLGHAFVVLMEHNLTGAVLKWGAFALGAGGVLLAVCCNRLRNHALATALGALGAVLFWGSWVEFMYIGYARWAQVPPLMDGDVVLTKPEYLIMPPTIPFALVTFLMCIFKGHTDWAVIKGIRKILHIKTEEPRYPAMSAFIDLLLLIWWAYLVLLVAFDRDLLGESHPVTLGIATVCLVAWVILFVLSLRCNDWASGLRQAIVNVCVIWTFIEVMIKLQFFTEIWIHPAQYVVEMVLILVAFAASILILWLVSSRSKQIK